MDHEIIECLIHHLSDKKCMFPLRVFEAVALHACSVVSDSLGPYGLLCLCDFSGKRTGVGCHFLL